MSKQKWIPKLCAWKTVRRLTLSWNASLKRFRKCCQCSVEILWIGLLKNGLIPSSSIEKSVRTPKMQKSRFDAGIEHVKWTSENWQSDIFSDEEKFIMHGCWFFLSQMMRSWISYKNVGRLHFIHETLNVEDYSTVLTTELINTMRDHFCQPENDMYLHDCAL